MERISLTRAQFEKRYGLKPEPAAIGMIFCGTAYGGDVVPVCEFVFVDDQAPIVDIRGVKELRRIHALPCPRPLDLIYKETR